MKNYSFLFILFVFYHYSFCVNTLNRDKWIVVTTINKPTEAIKQLSKLAEWQVVVVADKKTPTDWHVPGIIFLDVKAQEKLNYKILNYLPWNHYCRKNIGYLYAIAHGAKIIYETDDDNFLINEQLTILSEYNEMVRLVGDAREINPYSYFGQQTVWPRGYPLKSIFLQMQETYISDQSFIPIQQGLVDQDPDVDAIFRLTRQEQIFFMDDIPLVLKKRSFAPFNSQNTTFYYSAFWGLFMPSSISMRVADIWRGYWIQRLLWDIGAQLCFTKSSAYQERNEHDLLRDFKDEIDLYLKVDSLIDLLRTWKSNYVTMEDRIVDLFICLIHNQFIKEEDLNLVKAWIEDLKMIGYKFPFLESELV